MLLAHSSTIKFLGIDGVSGDDVSGSLIVSTSNLTSSTFTLNIKNTTDTPYQAVVYTTQINNASADYAIKNDFANVFMSEATRYVAPKLFYSFCDAGVFDVVKWYKGVSGIFDFGMIVPDVKALFIKTVIQRSSYTGYDCTIYIPPNSTFTAEYDWSYIGDYKNDTDYYFNVVGLQLPETCERAFISYETGIGGSFDGYLNYYSHSFRFTDSEFKFVNPFQFIPTDKNTNNYDFSKEFENYLKTELSLTLDDFNLALNNNTDINVNGTLISPITLFNDFKANIIASLGGIKAELGSLIDTVKLGYGGSNSYQNVINYSNNPYSYYDETTTETTINNNYDGSCNFHEDSFFNRFVKTLNYLFVPSDNYFSAWNDTFRETLNSKLPVANTLKNFSIDLHNALYDSWSSLDYDTVSQLPVQDGFGGNVLPSTTDTDVVTYASVNSDTESIPKFTFTYKKKEYTIIDFTWYARYRDTIFNIINIIAYTFFFIHLFKSLPSIIAGISSESGEHKYDN